MVSFINICFALSELAFYHIPLLTTLILTPLFGGYIRHIFQSVVYVLFPPVAFIIILPCILGSSSSEQHISMSAIIIFLILNAPLNPSFICTGYQSDQSLQNPSNTMVQFKFPSKFEFVLLVLTAIMAGLNFGRGKGLVALTKKLIGFVAALAALIGTCIIDNVPAQDLPLHNRDGAALAACPKGAGWLTKAKAFQPTATPSRPFASSTTYLPLTIGHHNPLGWTPCIISSHAFMQ
ncbi:hypothetical protein K439DRAFT_1616639 [Ramaria rubella]|nr:hypothetical protein K439DRAFT_1616639 [Ramaria rubella]